MRDTCVVAALLAVLCGPVGPCTAADGQTSNRVEAIVNQDIITLEDVRSHGEKLLAALNPDSPPSERAKASTRILREARRLLIEEKLLDAEGKRLLESTPGLSREIEDRVSRRLESDRRAAGGTVEFRAALKKEGLTYPQYKDRLRVQALRDYVLFRHVFSGASVSPDEMLDFYLANKGRFQELPQVRHRQIFIRAKKYKSRAEARKAAEDVMDQLRKGEPFAELAKNRSNGPRRENGGLWDFVRQGVRPKPVDQLLFSLPVGEVGGPVETEIGYTIVKVEAHKPGRTIPFEEVQPKIEALLKARRQDVRYLELMRRLEEENYVERRE